MKRFIITLTMAFTIFIVAPAFAETQLSVEVATVARSVEDRVPVGESTSFPYDTEKVYFYTKLIDGESGEYVEHVWRYGEREMARVTLDIGGPNWRTHSSKRIIRSWTGDWSVDVVSRGQVLKTVRFTITEPEPETKYNN